MPPKFDPSAVHEGNLNLYSICEKAFFLFKLIYLFFLVILRVTGGEGAATAALAPKIGPLGLVSRSIWFILVLVLYDKFFNLFILIDNENSLGSQEDLGRYRQEHRWLERFENHGQADHSEPSSQDWRRSVGFVARYQGFEGAATRQEEGQEQ